MPHPFKSRRPQLFTQGNRTPWRGRFPGWRARAKHLDALTSTEAAALARRRGFQLADVSAESEPLPCQPQPVKS